LGRIERTRERGGGSGEEARRRKRGGSEERRGGVFNFSLYKWCTFMFFRQREREREGGRE